MKTLNKYSKFIPYLYFIAVVIYWFTTLNKSNGIKAYPVLLFAIPFLFQLIKPSKKLNFALGITFVCLSSYLIVAYLISIIYTSQAINTFILYGGLFVMANFFMALWIIKNSIRSEFSS